MDKLGKNKLVLILGLILAVFLGVYTVNQYQVQKALSQRQDMIHQRGSLVMPFDLNETTHVFSTMDEGGTMQVKAKDPGNVDQIELIRVHLKEEVNNFNNADFSDPKTLHGANMPGLDVLSQAQGKYTTEYSELADGAQLTFMTSDPEVMNAIHIWFMAQMTDHGTDAMGM